MAQMKLQAARVDGGLYIMGFKKKTVNHIPGSKLQVDAVSPVYYNTVRLICPPLGLDI
jgi:hypothetical protein